MCWLQAPWLTCPASAVGEDGELPGELAKHDPRLIEAVCNEVRPLRAQRRIAGAQLARQG